MKIVNKTDFTKTLNLPKKVIKIGNSQIKKEEYFLDKIQDFKKYQYILNKNIKNGKKYKIIEMPTDIENRLSSTIILNKILKDIIIKNKLMSGNCIDHKLIFTNVSNMEQIDKLPNSKTNLQELIKSRQQKRKQLDTMFKGQIVEINNLGTTINYERDTLTTVKTDFEVEMINKFYDMYKQGRLEKQVRSVHWCTKCGTSKRRSDLIFENKEVTNYYILYKVEEDRGLFSKYDNLKNTYFIASTIKPWLMVTSENIALSNQLEYALVEVLENNKKIHYILATEFVDSVMQKEFITKYEIKQVFKAEEISKVMCMNPLDYRKRIEILITDKDKVSYSKNDSTGIRIVSSGHTYIDYLILKDKKSEAIKPIISEFGKTTNASIVFQNMEYTEINEKIIEYLKKSEFIYSTSRINLKIPLCDVCKTETIFRPINDWYVVKTNENNISEETVRDLVKKTSANENYKKNELTNSVKKINTIKEVLISDKNIIGTPIPVFYCAECGANVITEKTIEILTKTIKNKGSDIWYKQTPEELIQGQEACKKCGCTFFFKENATLNNFFKDICINLLQKDMLQKEQDVTNILVESKEEFINNLSALSFIENPEESIKKFDKVLIHSSVKEKVKSDIVLDDAKNKRRHFTIFKKKKKSNIQIESGIKDTVSFYGTDILRLWVAVSYNKEKISLSKEGLSSINKEYKCIRKVFNFLLANLYGFNPNKNYIEIDKRNDIDKYVYNELYSVTEKCKEAYSNLQFYKVYNYLIEFGKKVLCDKYFDSIKYKLYILNENSKARRSVQSNLHDIISTISCLWYPIIPFTLEEIWPYIYHRTEEEDRIIYTHDIDLKNILDTDKDVIMKWKRIFAVKERFDEKIRKSQTDKIIKDTLEARINLNTNDYTKRFVEDNYEDLLECVNVSSIQANVSNEHTVSIEKEPGQKCARCGHYTNEIGKNLKYRYLCPNCADILENVEKNN